MLSYSWCKVMIRNLIVYLTIILGASILVSSQQQGWRGIVPLHSTREDVERLIGPPMKPGGITYDLTDERVNIGYSAVPCTKGWPYGWNVPKDTVTSIRVYTKKKLNLSDLRLDLRTYTK